jgi:hypothetical protein
MSENETEMMFEQPLSAIRARNEEREKMTQRIASLEASLKFVQLDRDNMISAYEVGVKVMGDLRRKIADLEALSDLYDQQLNAYTAYIESLRERLGNWERLHEWAVQDGQAKKSAQRVRERT